METLSGIVAVRGIKLWPNTTFRNSFIQKIRRHFGILGMQTFYDKLDTMNAVLCVWVSVKAAGIEWYVLKHIYNFQFLHSFLWLLCHVYLFFSAKYVSCLCDMYRMSQPRALLHGFSSVFLLVLIHVKHSTGTTFAGCVCVVICFVILWNHAVSVII